VSEIPRQIDRRVRREIAALDQPWELIKKKDHYFLQVEDQPLLCVASNSSKTTDWQVTKTLNRLRKAAAMRRA
jgi:hypothetical protein